MSVKANSPLRDEQGLVMHFTLMRDGARGMRGDDDLGGGLYWRVSDCKGNKTLHSDSHLPTTHVVAAPSLNLSRARPQGRKTSRLRDGVAMVGWLSP